VAPPSPPPLPFALLTAYGPRHAGIDLRAPAGTPVLAAADGTVLVAAGRGRAGRMVVLAHAADVASVYMHLSAIAVTVGQPVRRGEPIGRSGMTGNATTPHLHFAVCRRPGGRCGVGSGGDGGWDDPAGYWIDGDPCFAPGRAYGPPVRFTYPLPCGVPTEPYSLRDAEPA
jgi:murein DD-endopeptidase MepM/ murein hydrolase activator NlpD